MRVPGSLACLLVLALLAACESGKGPGIQPSDLPDVPEAAGTDEGSDGPVGDRPDAPEDAVPADAVPDPVADLSPDAPEDVAPDAADAAPDPAADAPGDAAPEVDCPPSEPFDYTCDPRVPSSCPSGWCVLGQCVAPRLDPDRWTTCGDGTCGPCETATGCPADCAGIPPTTGTKEYENATTMTVWVHGFSNKSPDEMQEMVYGRDRGCGGILHDMAMYGVVRPCSDDAAGALAPDQLTRVEYYGGTPAAWLTAADIAEIEAYPYDGPTALRRYGLIVAKFIRWKMAVSGATHVNLACHSMGCYVLRHVIENDLEGLASSNAFVRWFTSSGVIAGARLARLYDNPSVQKAADAIGLLLSDFVIMNPDFAQDWTATWDHRLWEANSPLYHGMLIHQLGGTDPQIREALNIALLDLNNPGDLPNDGIMYTEDEYFHRQAPTGAVKTPSGKVVSATHSLVHEYHMQVPDTPAATLLAAATLFHHRRVFIRVDEFSLYKDRESHTLLDGENGTAPAEITWAVEVRYDPYVHDTFGKDVRVHEDKVEHRAPPLWKQSEGTTSRPGRVVFEGPVFDAQDRLRLSLDFLEADWFPRYGVKEWAFDVHESLLSYDGEVMLRDGPLEISSQYARARLSVEVVDLY